MTTAEELHALAERVPADGPPAVTLVRQRAASAAEAVTAALSTDLAERQQRWLDVLAELLRRLTPLAVPLLLKPLRPLGALGGSGEWWLPTSTGLSGI